MAISFGSRAFMAALLTAMLFCNPLTAFAQTSPDADAAIVRDLDAFIERVMATDLTPGLGVAVVRGANVIYVKGFGFADRERRRRATADTQFYIASTTKSFTALAGALLASRGLIDLDMPLSRALPGAKFHPEVSPDRITLRDLLTHTHGIRGGPIEIRTAFTGEFTNAQLLDILKFHAPAPTGRSFAYSNLGYNIFGMVLDEKFKEGWKQVLQREVFDPLDLRSTTAWISKVDPNRLAQPYELRAGSAPERVDYAKRPPIRRSAQGNHWGLIVESACASWPAALAHPAVPAHEVDELRNASSVSSMGVARIGSTRASTGSMAPSVRQVGSDTRGTGSYVRADAKTSRWCGSHPPAS